ncbi:MAG: alanine--tRNA ligase-related protein, partial [Vicinamibacterales bacterium]|nr:alanine--tRNA ligase-related protein [Vicinamibacterales bacterium]
LAEAETRGTLAGLDVFQLYDTYGLPLDFMEDLAGERGIAIDRDGFDAALDVQRQQSRATANFSTGKAAEFVFASDAARDSVMATSDRFEGYTATQVSDTTVLALFGESRSEVAELGVGAEGYAVLDSTPFYLEAGGQVSDTGQLTDADTGLVAEVTGVERVAPGAPRAHRVRVTEGCLGAGAHVTADVDATRRDATRRHHTATHLLHAALRDQLGPHVKQAGSLVAPDRLRFDFAHGSPIDQTALNEIEQHVNTAVLANIPVDTDVRATQDAIDSGAMALFGEKYGESVRVVSVAGVSMELCGGTHCRATGDIGLFAITQESGVAAGVRRIEAVTGHTAVRLFQSRRAVVHAVLDALSVPESQAVEAIGQLQGDTKRLARELEQFKLRAALGGQTGGATDDAVDIGDARLVARRVSGLEKGSLRGLADSLRDRLGRGVVVLASENDGKVALVVSVSQDLVGQVHAGQIVKALAPIIGGGGGGRPDFAQAGGRLPEQIDVLLTESRTVVGDMLAGQGQSKT